MAKDFDMKAALGTPETGKGKKKTSYLDSKSPELVSYLLEATDGDHARAEALCRAIEMSASPAPDPAGDMGDILGP